MRHGVCRGGSGHVWARNSHLDALTVASFQDADLTLPTPLGSCRNSRVDAGRRGSGCPDRTVCRSCVPRAPAGGRVCGSAATGRGSRTSVGGAGEAAGCDFVVAATGRRLADRLESARFDSAGVTQDSANQSRRASARGNERSYAECRRRPRRSDGPAGSGRQLRHRGTL